MEQERRKDFEKRAAFSDDMFRTMFRSASVGMAITDTRERRLLDVNEKFCQIVGYTREELIGIRTTNLTHPDDRKGDEEKYWLAADKTSGQHLTEKRYLRKDGTVVWVRVNAAFVRDATGRPLRTMAVVEDISERVQAESAARQSERRLKIFLDGIPDRVRLKDTEGRYLAASLSDAQALGAATVEEIIGKTLADFRPDAIARREREEDQEIMQSRRTLHAEHQRADGRWYDVIKAPIWDDTGKAAGVVTVARDITDRKRVEEQLRETEYRLREFLDGIPSRAWFKDAQGRYLMLNSREAEAQGSQADSIIGKSVQEFLPEDEAAVVNEEDSRVLMDGRTLRIERQSNVTGAWTEIVKAPVRSRDGAVIGIVGVSRDISERKAAEAALRKSEAELRAAKAAAEEANRAKGEFLSHMSHEMRTPMNAILGFAELGLLEHPEPNQREHLTKITAASKSLLRVIDDVLDFERVDAGKLQLDSIDFRIGDVLQNVRDVVEGTAAAKGLTLRMKSAHDMPPRLKGDPARIGQVLINLCANAVKFTSRGSVEVMVRAEPSPGANPMLRFSVRDTGIGISREELARLFQPFTQADSSTTRRYGGTGLGLVICKRLIELMGGRIWIESEPGGGTTVFFTVTCEAGREASAAKGTSNEQLPAEAAALHGKRVLIVDDHPINRMLMAKLLKLAGAEGVPAESGVDALRVLAEAQSMDLVLMDLRMPEMDGYEATRRIRADARWAQLPIVAVTASAATYERARCMAAGMNDVMIKPIHQAVFFPVIAAAMSQQNHKNQLKTSS